MNTKELSELIVRLSQNPGQRINERDMELLRVSKESYPYFAPAFIELALRAEHKQHDLRMQAAMRGFGHPEFRNALERGEWIGFYPREERPVQIDTDETIDTFLKTYGKMSPEEEEVLEKLIFNPVPDYSEVLLREETETDQKDLGALADLSSVESKSDSELGDTHHEVCPPPFMPGFVDESILIKEDLIEREESVVVPPPYVAPDEFLETDSDKVEETSVVTSIPKEKIEDIVLKEERPQTKHMSCGGNHDSSLLSESLAKIYIRQGRYERAYEIISSINLKFPKKSVYFADQLRFLEKLILNQKAQNSSDSKNEDQNKENK